MANTPGLMAALLSCEPQHGELERRTAAVTRLRRILEATLPGATATLVGSVASGLAMAGADLDFELSGVEMSGGALERLRDALATEAGVRRCEVIFTRSKAPDLLRFHDGQISVDCSLRHGSGGQSAGRAKAAFVRAHSTTPRVRALQLLVKLWAKKRALIDPTNGRLNSFAWALMVTFFVQHEHPKLLDQTPGAADGDEATAGDADFWQTLRLCCNGARQEAEEAALGELLHGFFCFWRDFDLRLVASVRCRCALPLDECPKLVDAARARVQSADARCYLPQQSSSLMPSLLLEDPAETDENVARTLSATFEWRAELARASDLTRSAAPLVVWGELSAPPGRKRPELAGYWLAGLDGAGGFPPELRVRLEAFLAGDGTPKLALPPMEGGQRLAMHELAEALGITSKSEGAGSTRHAVWYRPKGYVGVGKGTGVALPAAGGTALKEEASKGEEEAEPASATRQNAFALLCDDEDDVDDIDDE